MNIGFIGLGNLGSPIALNIIEGGHHLYVYNRTVAKTAPLLAKGAVVCPSIKVLAKECAIVFSIVSDDAAIEAVTAELVNHLAADSIHISMSTILPHTAQLLAGLHQSVNQHYIAAPVFGRPEAAASKKLNFVISGAPAPKSKAMLLLKDAGAAGIFDFGESVAAANIVKLCGNFLIGAAMEAIGESAALASHSGVDPIQMWHMFSQTLFNTALYHNYSKIILQQQFEPAAFTAKLGLKDMNLVLQQAAAVNQQLPLAALLKNNMQSLVDKGKENIDWSAVSLGGQPG